MLETELISQILDGYKSAERLLYDRYKSKWYMLALRYSRTKDEANDIMQEGLIEVFKDLHQYDARKSKFTTWSSRIMVHAALRYLKKTQWQNTFSDIANKDYDQSVKEDVYSKLAAEELTYMIQQLPTGYKIVFNMYVIEGYSHQEIADHLGIAVGTSKSQLSKAKKMLRNQLENQIKSNSNG